MTHIEVKESWEEEFREYFDKTLKPKKPTMGGLDREMCIDFISKIINSKLLQIKEEIEQLPDTYEDEESKVFKTTKNEILAILNNHTR